MTSDATKRGSSRSAASSLVLPSLFVAVNVIVASTLLRGARLDLTDNGSTRSRKARSTILRKLEEPITLRFYFSDQARATRSRSFGTTPARARAARGIRGALGRQAARSRSSTPSPSPRTRTARRVRPAGRAARPAAASTLYFGLAGTNTTDERRDDPVLPARQASASSSTTSPSSIYNLADREEAGRWAAHAACRWRASFDPQAAQPPQPWAIDRAAAQLFEVQAVEPTPARDPGRHRRADGRAPARIWPTRRCTRSTSSCCAAAGARVRRSALRGASSSRAAAWRRRRPHRLRPARCSRPGASRCRRRVAGDRDRAARHGAPECAWRGRLHRLARLARGGLRRHDFVTSETRLINSRRRHPEAQGRRHDDDHAADRDQRGRGALEVDLSSSRPTRALLADFVPEESACCSRRASAGR